jgi:hypothetical protein
MTADSESLLSRWSRRKLQSRVVNEQEDELLDQNQMLSDDDLAQPEFEEIPIDASDQEPVLTDADMPDLETLNEDSDYSLFMSRGVSDKLRNLALKKMFQAPVFNIRDGLDEYDEDYTSFEPLGDIVTSDMKHQIEMEAKKKLQAEIETGNEEEGNSLEQQLEEDEKSSPDPTEADMKETDITEKDISESSQQDGTQPLSTTSSQTEPPKIIAENKQHNE